MRKIILSIVLILVIVLPSCNKNSSKTLAPNQEVWCVYKYVNYNRVFHKCVDSNEKANQEVIKLRGDGINADATKKSDCNDC